MATPRKHWFRVADSILNETWDAKTTHTIVRLMAFLNGRWAREGLDASEAAEAIIDGRTALWITGERREHLALKRIFDLPIEASIANLETGVVVVDEVRRSDGQRLSGALDADWERARRLLESLKKPTRISLSWPNFADFQGFTSRETPPPPPPPQDAPARRKEGKSRSMKAARSARATARRSPPPADLEPAEHEALAAWCRGRLARPDLAARLPELVEACLTHHRAKGNLAASWYATAQTWVRNEAEERFGRARRVNGSGGRPDTGWSEADREDLARVQAEIRAERGRG